MIGFRFERSLIVLLVLAAAGCKDEPKSTTTTQASATPVNQDIPDDFVVNSFFTQPNNKLAVKHDGGTPFGETPTANEQPDGTKMKILDPGAEPRARLAYNLALGKTTSVVATITTEMKGPDIPEGQGKQPPVKLTISVTPKKKLDANKTQVDFKIGKLDMGPVPPEAQRQIGALQAAVEKLVGTVNVSSGGQATELALQGAETLPRGSGEQIISLVERALELLVVPLPPVPVGIGARWQHTTAIPEQGASVESNFTWLAKNDANYELKVETRRLVAGRTLRDGSGKVVTLEVKGDSTFTVTTGLDGPTSKASGESKTDIITQAQGEGKHVNGEKTTMTIEKVEAPKK